LGDLFVAPYNMGYDEDIFAQVRTEYKFDEVNSISYSQISAVGSGAKTPELVDDSPAYEAWTGELTQTIGGNKKHYEMNFSQMAITKTTVYGKGSDGLGAF